jgi:hypothetical protein
MFFGILSLCLIVVTMFHITIILLIFSDLKWWFISIRGGQAEYIRDPVGTYVLLFCWSFPMDLCARIFFAGPDLFFDLYPIDNIPKRYSRMYAFDLKK